MVREVGDKDSVEADDDNNNIDEDQIVSQTAPVRASTNSKIKQELDENNLSFKSTDLIDCFPNSTNNYNHAQDPFENNDHIQSDQTAGLHSEEPEQLRKLFIGGLDYKTSEATLKQHFEKFGDVLDCVVMREPQSKRSRGFGFVIYSSSQMVDKAQESRPHEIDGREVQSKRAIAREDSGKPEAQATVKKVYLGGLSDDIEESELRNYFRNFGNIINVNIVAHKDTGKRRGFAFVEYDDYDPVDKIVLKKFHIIRDKRIEAKKAIPKVEMDARKRGDPRAALAGAMMALTGPPLDCTTVRSRSSRNGNVAACMWSEVPYNSVGYPSGYSNQSNLNGHPPHYESPAVNYYVGNWAMQHSNQGGAPYNFRGAHGANYGRNSYGSGNWTSASPNYNTFSTSQGVSGSAGPMRLSYQHRSWGPYGGSYGSHRGRGYN